MTEDEWLQEVRVDVMLPWLQRAKKRKLSPRKLRLFGVACCRRAWRRLNAELRRQVETAEQHADGLVKDAVLKAAWRANCKMEHDRTKGGAVGWLLWGPWLNWKTPEWATTAVASQLAEKGGWPWGNVDERDAQADLIREVAGNPFRKVVWRPEWAEANDQQAAKLAESIYEDRAFDRLPILGDALEEAGCTDQNILGHLRNPGGHTRGCWALDLVLAKE
jgi:hypothetical protein